MTIQQRQLVSEIIDDIDTDFHKRLCGTLDQVIANLQQIKQEHDGRYDNLRIEIECSRSYDESYFRCELVGQRLESDKQYAARLALEERNKVLAEEGRKRRFEHDYQVYLALKQRFDNESNVPSMHGET